MSSKWEGIMSQKSTVRHFYHFEGKSPRSRRSTLNVGAQTYFNPNPPLPLMPLLTFTDIVVVKWVQPGSHRKRPRKRNLSGRDRIYGPTLSDLSSSVRTKGGTPPSVRRPPLLLRSVSPLSTSLCYRVDSTHGSGIQVHEDETDWKDSRPAR